ncbi:bifunctional pyr operon transcriptional regulator/uracil phosphoribosyltransferase PyrR [bacterium]|nr:bifunctional pyr operon transcriptional regulator/uracil phosphoribosyltransferase PyrR [bacterium]
MGNAGQIAMDAARVERTLRRMASQIVEQCGDDPDRLVLLAIPAGGVPVTARLAAEIARETGRAIATGVLDITLYRDDLSFSKKPRLAETRLDFDLHGKNVVLVDDVLFTGRTIRAALDALLEYGRPAVVRAAVLVDRGHRELPIRADFVGVWLDTVRDDDVTVTVGETPAADDLVEITPHKEAAK